MSWYTLWYLLFFTHLAGGLLCSFRENPKTQPKGWETQEASWKETRMRVFYVVVAFFFKYHDMLAILMTFGSQLMTAECLQVANYKLYTHHSQRS